MAKKVLVDADVQLGDKILAALDAAKFPVSVAIWILTEKNEGWKFVIGTPLYDRLRPLELHRKLIVALRKDDPESRDFDDIQLRGNRDPFISGLRKLFGKTASVKGMRLGGHHIGDEWLDDAIVYRIK